MRIKTIEINNYKAFYGHHKINVAGKNLFIYGENGSGKSSLYYALKDFFQSSIENINLDELENIFVSDKKKHKTAINVTFKPNSLGQNRQKLYRFNTNENDTRAANDTSIRDGNKLKSFLTYKHLLAIHHLKKDESINLFDLLVKGVLRHFKYSLTGDKELGALWDVAEDRIGRRTGREYPGNRKKTDVNTAIKSFNKAFSELFKPESPEYILKHAKPFLDYFNHNIDLNLYFSQVHPNTDYTKLEGAEIRVEISYSGKKIHKPHMFLNEARLSAIAISIYLGLIKRHVQGIPCKVLFLDDIFIGLDIANRLPLLKILKSEFPKYQVFITTYDKPWYEYAKSYLEGEEGWITLEFYAEETKDGFEIPKIFDNQDLLSKAEWHYRNSDYKAAAVYTRSAFEKIIRKYCVKKKKKIIYKARLKDYTSQDFWKEVAKDVNGKTKANIEQYRDLVLNTFSHYNTEKHEIKTELASAIETVKKLKDELKSK